MHSNEIDELVPEYPQKDRTSVSNAIMMPRNDKLFAFDCIVSIKDLPILFSLLVGLAAVSNFIRKKSFFNVFTLEIAPSRFGLRQIQKRLALPIMNEKLF